MSGTKKLMAKKILGTAGKVLSIFDTVEIVGKVVDGSTTVIDQELKRRHERQKDLINIPDVVELPLSEATQHLEDLGFTVLSVLAQPHPRYQMFTAQQVVNMSPKTGKAQPSSLIKLYYVNEDIIAQSQSALTLPSLSGLSLDQATQILEDYKFKVVAVPVAASRSYANKGLNTVIASDPKASTLSKNLSKNGVVKLRYLDAVGLEESQQLQSKYEAQIAQLGKTVKQFIPKKRG